MRVELTALGQSGYALRAESGELLLVDPYLSDYVEEELGAARIAPAVLDIESAAAIALVATHWHPDHLDPPTCRALARTQPDLVFVGPPSNRSRLLGWGIAPEQVVTLEREDSVTLGPFTVHGGFARHEVPGWLAEDALSLVLEVDGARIFHSGDTEYDARLLTARRHAPFDLGLFVINGTGGNMNAPEAALLAHELAPALAVPCHYDMWRPEDYGHEATLDPKIFEDYCRRLGGPPTCVLQVGTTHQLG